jgi:hypothetical protein
LKIQNCGGNLPNKKIKISAFGLQKNKSKEIKDIEHRIQQIQITDPNTKELNDLEVELQAKYEKKAQGPRIRARVRWYEEGEKSTKYFYNVEQNKEDQSYGTKLKP